MANPGVAERYQSRTAAAEYDRSRFGSLLGRYKNWKLRRMIGAITASLAPRSLVVDLPCGTGRIDNWLLGAQARVIGVDLSNEMLEQARRNVRPTPLLRGFLRADATRLPFQSDSIDAVFCIRFFHLLKEETRLAVLGEIARVARGTIVVEDRRIESRLKAFRRLLTGWITGRPEPSKRSLQHVRAEFERAGLTVEQPYYLNRWLSSSVLVRGRRRVRTGNQ
jgi:ubiquinone/menaquinone biosynthesis C-methylase UbiE